MGFLKRFFRNVFREGAAPAGTSSFERLGEEELEAHLGVARYGNFLLTDAVRPSYDLQVVPDAGLSPRHLPRRAEPDHRAGADGRRFQENALRDLHGPARSAGRAWSTWFWKPATTATSNGHTDLYREHIDVPVLKSILWEYEDLLVNDGCTGLAVLNPDVPHEIQFDEHKLLIVYGDAVGRIRGSLPPAARRLRRAAGVHHRGRARPFLQRPLRPAVRRAENCGWGWIATIRESQERGVWTPVPSYK